MEEKKFLQSSIIEEAGEKLYIASDDTIDRHGESISIDAWDLKNYKQNPVVLAFHNYETPPIGMAEKIGFKTIEGKTRLVYKPVFHGKTELSKLYKELEEEGYPIASSVGFIAKEMQDNVITKAELLEISIVGVPANPAAMRLAYSKGYSDETIEKAFVKDENPEIEALKAEMAELKSTIKSLQEVKQPDEVTGRNPMHTRKSKKEIERRIVIKAINKFVDKLNKIEKERNEN